MSATASVNVSLSGQYATGTDEAISKAILSSSKDAPNDSLSRCPPAPEPSL
jgi:hypothetical protein